MMGVMEGIDSSQGRDWLKLGKVLMGAIKGVDSTLGRY